MLSTYNSRSLYQPVQRPLFLSLLWCAGCLGKRRARVVRGYPEVGMRGDRLTRSYWLHFHSYRYQGFKLLMLGVSVVCLESLFGLAPSQADVLMDPWSSLTSEEKQFRDELWENVGYRGYGYLTKPYSDEAVFAALDALEHSEGVMTGLVLGVLSKAIQQFEVPPKLLRETVVPQLRGLLAEQEAQEDQQAREVVKWTEQVLWHCEVNLLTDAAARRAFLAPSLRDGRRGESHQLTAMEYCVQWGDAETEALVQRELDAERAKPHPRQRLAVRLDLTLVQIKIMQGLRSQGDSAQRAAYLKAVVWQYPKGPVEHGDTFYFAAWLIHHLTQLPDEDAIPVLKAIWQCTDCHTWYRDRV